MLIGGKPTDKDSKRSSRRQRPNNAQSYNKNSTDNNSSLQVTNNNNNNKETASGGKSQSSSASSTSSAAEGALATKENHDPKSTANAQNVPQSQGNDAANTSAAAVGGNINNNSNANSINKKIPKHKWRPLQIDLAKSSRPKSIGRPARRPLSTQQRYPDRSRQRPFTNGNTEAGSANTEATNERRSQNTTSSGRPTGEFSAQQQRSYGGGNNKRTGNGPNERVDSWRSSGGAERGERDFDRSSRTQRRFRTSYRGGRQGRGGFARSGPGRPSNRIPRHLLANGEYANYLPADGAGTDQSYILMGSHYYHYGRMHAAYIEMDAQSVKEAITKQV